MVSAGRLGRSGTCTERTGQDVVCITEEVEGDLELAVVQLVMTEVKWGRG